MIASKPLGSRTPGPTCDSASVRSLRPHDGFRPQIRPATAAGLRVVLVAGLIAVLALTCPAAGLARAAVDAPSPTAGDTIRVDTLTATPDAEPSNPAATPARPAATWEGANILPFAHNEIPATYPEVSVAFGLAAYLSSFTEVEHAFRAIEEVYRAAGYSVPVAADVATGPMTLATLTVWLNRWLDVSCQLGRTGSADNELRLLGGIVSGRYTLPAAGKVSLRAGLGGGANGFSFSRAYGVQVTPFDGSGGYYTLERITLKGGGRYWTAAGGLTIRTGPHGALDALIQYVGMGDVSTDTARAGKVSMNLSGAMIGASFTYFF